MSGPAEGTDPPVQPGGERLTNTPAGVRLCLLESLQDGHARNFVLEIGDRRFHGFVVRTGETVHGYVDRCPHMGLPLAQRLDDYMAPSGDLIACSWHGALFRIDDGRCVGGPCVGAHLSPWPVRVRDGMVETA
ncbi:MAG TPA: Rieske (2Fe-2S) protein [Caulobacteraceae bacterium]|jgi:nitrite reductase/ring-hydroxylating ferredoxin subunit|nr:Rieske (2Fe-2S) protein [Caulobacteraceae bacterium]